MVFPEIEDNSNQREPLVKHLCCCFSKLGAMKKCFNLFGDNNKRDDQISKSTVSAFTEEMKKSTLNAGSSELNSRDVSDGSAESSARRGSGFQSLSQRPSDLKAFTVTELKTATKNFSRSAMIGEGGFGCVYRGFVKSPNDPAKKTEVAVKQLGKRGLQGHKEWVTEVNVLGVVEHPNLVKLVGYCAEDDERGIQRLLVYEFMPNGSVEQHLSHRAPKPLPWSTRLRIALDAARGLAHLHEEMDFQIIFRDFKSSNILLDEQWNAKLSDFGMARLGPPEGLTHVSTAVVGTMGYAAPEYIQTGRLTSKNDVWSYGVFLYELITGRKPIDRNRPKGEQKLLEWIRPHLGETKKFRLIVDPRLEGKYSLKSVQRLSLVANRCLARLPKNRPKMSEVLEMVAKVSESSNWVGTETPPVLLKNIPSSSLSPRDNELGKNNKRRIVETTKTGETFWSFRVWPPKFIRTC